MKMKTLIASLLMVVGFSMSLSAQNEDCLKNSSISHNFVKVKNYADAYDSWQKVLAECPTLRYYTFTDGKKILKDFLKKEKKGSPEYQKHFDELMSMYDKLIEVTPDFATRMKVPNANRVLGDKAIDFLTLSPKPDLFQAYKWLGEVIEKEGFKAGATNIYYYLQVSQYIVKAKADHKETFVQDYLATTELCDKAVEALPTEKSKKAYESTKEALNGIFINSGVADCATLESIYAPRVEENKENLEYLTKVLGILDWMKCNESDTYAKASYYSYKIQPTTAGAYGVAVQAYKKGNIDEAITLFQESIDLEEDMTKKAEKAYKTAYVLYGKSRYSQARKLALQAAKYNENYGAPYILIAKMYAASHNWNKEPVLNQCAYYAAVDKLYRAKKVDPSVAEEANKLISSYSSYFPAKDKLFFLGLKKGDTVKIGSWIGETVTIR